MCYLNELHDTMDLDSIRKSMLAMLNEKTFIPEPQGSNFCKFLGESKTKNVMVADEIMWQCNSHGIQLRNDLTYPLHWREFGVGDSSAPVLRSDHLERIVTFKNLLNQLKELPKEWTVVQITKGFNPMDVLGVTKQQLSGDPTLLIARLPCGDALETTPPYSIRVQPTGRSVEGLNILQKLEELMEQRREFYSQPHNKKLQHVIKTTDSGLVSCLLEIENYWIREWKCLLSGSLVQTQLDLNIRQKISDKLRVDAINTDQVVVDIIFNLSVNAQHLKDKEILKALKTALPSVLDDGHILEPLVDFIKSLNIKDSCTIMKAEKHPVLLILDNSFEFIPWEMTTVLTGHPVCRVPSLSMLYAMFKYHQPHIVNGYRQLPVDSAYCLLNPGKDLLSCEKRMGDFLAENLPWVQVKAGEAPEPVELATKLIDHHLFLYCGHGSGSMYFSGGTLKKSPVNGLVILYGCSSSLPRGNGGRTPHQNNIYTYLSNGCCSLIGALYDLSSTDADLAGIATLSKMLPSISNISGKIEVKQPAEPNVMKAVLHGKTACQKYCTKCALIVRGIPVRIIVSSKEKSQILARLK